ncbi:MAG: multicopper oxidase domain-containing protein, partial [Mycoplasmatales bacterium]
TLDVDEGDIITINLVSNSSNSPHPFHLHGHEFSVIKVNDQKVNKSLLLDTVEVLPDEKVTIQFTANNPGIWAFHCHDLEHAARGMFTTINYNGYTTATYNKYNKSK